MRNTVYATRKATESHIAAINEEIAKLACMPCNTMSYTAVKDTMNHLRKFEEVLKYDLAYFKEIDAAMEQAVK